jgi:hypothetical protein
MMRGIIPEKRIEKMKRFNQERINSIKKRQEGFSQPTAGASKRGAEFAEENSKRFWIKTKA